MCFNVVSTSTVRLHGVFLDYVTLNKGESNFMARTRSFGDAVKCEAKWRTLYEKLSGHSATQAASHYWRLLCHDIYYDSDRRRDVRCCDDDYESYVAWRNELNLPATTWTLSGQMFDDAF